MQTMQKTWIEASRSDTFSENGVPRLPGHVGDHSNIIWRRPSFAAVTSNFLAYGLLLDQLSVIGLCVVSIKHHLCQKRLLTGCWSLPQKPIKIISHILLRLLYPLRASHVLQNALLLLFNKLVHIATGLIRVPSARY